MLFGVSIHILKSSTAHAVMQVCSCQVVVGVKVVWLHVPHVAHWVDEAVQRIHGDGHGTPIVADKEAKGTPLAGVAPALRASCTTLRSPSMSLTKSRIWSRVYRWESDHKPHIDVCDPFVLAICLEDQEDGGSPAELRRTLQQREHEHTLGNEFPQMVKRGVLHAEGSSYGMKANIPQVESILTLEGVKWDGALVHQHQLNTVEVKCHHLKRK